MSQTELRKVRVKMEAETARYQRDLEKSRKETAKWRKKAVSDVGAVGKSFRNLVAAAGLALITKRIVDATGAQSAAVAKLENTLVNANGRIGFSLQELTDKAAQLQKVSIFGDQQIIEAQALLGDFENIHGEVFARATQVAVDYASKSGESLESAFRRFGKALDQPKSKIGELAEAGISFSAEQIKLVQTLQEQGQLYEAQNIILETLESRYKGAALAVRSDFSGALTGLGNSIGDLFEATDGLDDAAESVEDLTGVLQDPETIKAVNTFTSALVSGLSKAVGFSVQLINYFGRLGRRIGGVESEGDIDRRIVDLNARRIEYLQRIDQFNASGQVAMADEAQRQLLRVTAQLDQLRAGRGSNLDVGDDDVSSGLIGSNMSSRDEPVDVVDASAQRAINAAQLKYARLHELALEAEGKQVELENARYEREREALVSEFAALDEKHALTSELKQEYYAALEDLHLAHESKLTDISKTEADKREEAERELQLAKLQIGRNALQMGAALTKEGSKANRILLAADKAMALQQSLLALQTAVAKANALGFPANIPAIAQATGIGLNAIATIKSVGVSGIAHGGLTDVPAESTYLLQKGERVLSPNQNKDFTQFIEGGAGAASSGNVVRLTANTYLDGNLIESKETLTEGDVVNILVGESSNPESQMMQSIKTHHSLPARGIV